MEECNLHGWWWGWTTHTSLWIEIACVLWCYVCHVMCVMILLCARMLLNYLHVLKYTNVGMLDSAVESTVRIDVNCVQLLIIGVCAAVHHWCVCSCSSLVCVQLCIIGVCAAAHHWCVCSCSSSHWNSLPNSKVFIIESNLWPGRCFKKKLCSQRVPKYCKFWLIWRDVIFKATNVAYL